MLCFEADLQVVRAGGEISLSASRWALAEAAIVADISAAVWRRTWTVAMSLATARMMTQILLMNYTTVEARYCRPRVRHGVTPRPPSSLL